MGMWREGLIQLRKGVVPDRNEQIEWELRNTKDRVLTLERQVLKLRKQVGESVDRMLTVQMETIKLVRMLSQKVDCKHDEIRSTVDSVGKLLGGN